MLEIIDFSKTYKGGKRAVDHLSLTVEAGNISLVFLDTMERARARPFGR